MNLRCWLRLKELTQFTNWKDPYNTRKTCISRFPVMGQNTCLTGRQVYFGSCFLSMIIKGRGVVHKSCSTHGRGRRAQRRREILLPGYYLRPTPWNKTPLPNYTFGYELTSSEIYWWAQHPHDPITFQKLHLWTHGTSGRHVDLHSNKD